MRQATRRKKKKNVFNPKLIAKNSNNKKKQTTYTLSFCEFTNKNPVKFMYKVCSSLIFKARKSPSLIIRKNTLFLLLEEENKSFFFQFAALPGNLK